MRIPAAEPAPVAAQAPDNPSQCTCHISQPSYLNHLHNRLVFHLQTRSWWLCVSHAFSTRCQKHLCKSWTERNVKRHGTDKHSNSSPAQHSQIDHPLPSPAKQTKPRKKTLLITQPFSCWILLWSHPSCLWPAIEKMRAQMLQQMFRCHISTVSP